MFRSFLPHKFCREFVELKGHSVLLTMTMATVKEIKPFMDEWISVDRFEAYKRICRRYGLYLRTDAIFKFIPGYAIPIDVIGSSCLVTTKALGYPMFSKIKAGAVHVMISKSKRNLDRGFMHGWYPLIIRNRVIDKPFIDHYRFGTSLGYPGCCNVFFQKYNNWKKYNFLYEIFKRSPKRNSYLCNPFTKDATYSYIYHMPCSYNCKKTIHLARQLRKEIKKEEPDFVDAIDQRLKLIFLVFREKKFYAFQGFLKKNRLHYKKVFFVNQELLLEKENDSFYERLEQGDSLEVRDEKIEIFQRGRIVHKIKPPKKSPCLEIPFLIQFSD